MSKRVMATLCALCISFTAFGAFPLPARAATIQEQIAALEKDQAALKKQIESAKGDVANSKGTRDLYLSQISNVEKQIDLLDGQISSLNQQTSAKNSTIADLENQIKQAKTEKADVQKKLGERLRAIDKRGNVTTLQMLLNTDSYADYLLKDKLMEVVAQKDQEAIDALEQKLADIAKKEAKVEAEKKHLQEQKAEVEALRTKSNAKKQELDGLYVKANAAYQQDQNELNKLNKELEQTEANIKKLLASLESKDSYVATSMFWPAPNVRRISSNFGYRWGTLHKGIDIANGAAYGHTIVAAADGTVIFSNTYDSWGGGYGYYCIVDHGRDSQGRQIVTLYAHMSANHAYVGQRVKGGQTVLGKIGNTGNSYGAHLHFEVRVNGVPTDPLKGYVSVNGK